MNLNEIAAKTLGSANSYAVYTDKYDTSLLNPMPRSLARDEYGVSVANGVDVWHCWETSFLLDNGAPVSGVTKFVYDANSPFMVESKSAKLFFNSFDMCKMGSTKETAIAAFEKIVADALSECVGVRVEVKFFDHAAPQMMIGVNELPALDDKYSSAIITDYNLGTNHLVKDADNLIQTKFVSMRSRCRHTKQKDTGVAYIHCTNVNEKSLYEHCVSFREKDEFHEFCADKLWYDLSQFGDAAVALCYNRRGSLDINPVRWSTSLPLALREFINVDNLVKGSYTQ